MLRSALRLIVITFIAIAWAAHADADPILIDFESFSDGDALGNQIPGVTFSSGQVLTAGISLNEIDFPPTSGSNAVVDTGGAIRIDFTSPLAAFGAYFTYVAPLTIEAFDAANHSLGIVSSAFAINLAFLGGTPNEFIEAAFGGIAAVQITGDALGGSFVMDDMVLTPREVPEPGTLSLVLLGVGASFARFTRSRRVIPKRC
jgi:hypothetical protein